MIQSRRFLVTVTQTSFVMQFEIYIRIRISIYSLPWQDLKMASDQQFRILAATLRIRSCSP